MRIPALAGFLSRLLCVSLAAVSWFIAPAGAQTAAPTAPQMPIPLELHKTIEKQLHTSDTALYSVKADAGQFIRVVAVQKGIDVTLTLIDPAGAEIARSDLMNGSFGPEMTSAIVAQGGEYRVRVHGIGDVSGHCALELTDLRAPTETDRKRIEAERTYMGGMQDWLDQKKTDAAAKWQISFEEWRALGDSYGEAVSLYSQSIVTSDRAQKEARLEQSLPLWKALGDRPGEARSLQGLGESYGVAREYGKGIEYQKQAAAIFHEVGDRVREARALDDIGVDDEGLGDDKAALEAYAQELELSKTLGDLKRESDALLSVARNQSRLGQTQEAIATYMELGSVSRQLKDVDGEGTALNGIGRVHMERGEEKEALDYYDQGLAKFREAGNRGDEAAALNNIGRVYDDQGEKQKALDYYAQAMPIYRDTGNKQGEATAFNNMASVYLNLGQTQKAQELFNQALDLRRETNDREGEGTELSNLAQVSLLLGGTQKALDLQLQALALMQTYGRANQVTTILGNIGMIYGRLGQNDKALDYFNQALKRARDTSDRMNEATMLNNLASIYGATGDRQKAIEYYQQAVPIMHSVGYRFGEALGLNNIAETYDSLGQPQKALESFSAALEIMKAIQSPEGEGTVLINLGKEYGELGEWQKSLDNLNQALAVFQRIGSKQGEAYALANSGKVYAQTGDVPKAVDTLERAQVLMHGLGNTTGEAAALANLGQLYDLHGEKQKAKEYLDQALPLFQQAGDLDGEGVELSNLGVLNESTGKPQVALEQFSQAISMLHSVQDPLNEAHALMLMMGHWYLAGNKPLAIFFGKQAIDELQAVRRNMAGMAKEEQQSFVNSNDLYYRILAEALVEEGRLAEAQSVLDSLKVEEYSEYSHTRGAAGSTVDPVAMTNVEQSAKSGGDAVAAQVTAIGREWLDLKSKPSRTADEQAQYEALAAKLNDANRRMQDYYKSLYASFGGGAAAANAQRDVANRSVEQTEGESRGLQNLLKGMSPGTVALYTLVLDDKTVIIVITPAAMVARDVPIAKTALRSKVFALVGAVQHPEQLESYLAKAQDLYKTLIGPVEGDLEGAKASTIVWSLDDVLRYVPVAALHDGREYLAERYANVVLTTTSMANLSAPKVSDWRALAMGVSKDYDGLGALAAVPGELDSVVKSGAVKDSHGPVPGMILLDDSFTAKNMEAALEQPPPLVHIATHFVFSAGDDEKSYLLLGGDATGGKGFHLTLADLRDDPRINFDGVELLTLSGCDTALGSNASSDGREVDSLGIVGQLRGAKSVIATLWKVDDASVGILMEKFYKLWTSNAGMTKSEALRQAQLALIHGTEGGADAKSSKYASPFYWAPFVLIGNWK